MVSLARRSSEGVRLSCLFFGFDLCVLEMVDGRWWQETLASASLAGVLQGMIVVSQRSRAVHGIPMESEW